MRLNILLVFLGVATLIKTQAQTENDYAEPALTLTFEDALAKTLENNYEIKVARINVEVAENNAEKMNNGYLPTLSANGNYGWTYNSGSFETVQGENSFDPNSAYNYGAGVDLNYTLWDGQGRKYAYQQNQSLRELSALQVQQLIENTILELSRVYCNASLQQSTVVSLEAAIAISADRLARAEYAYEYGQGTQLDILNARVDLNTDSVNLVNSQQQLNNSIRNVNIIMAEDISATYEISDNININKTLDRAQMLASAKVKNVQLASIDNNLLAEEFALGSAKAVLMPSVSANVGYDYRGSSDPNGAFVVGSATTGPNAGLTLNWNIFSGQNRTRVQNAKLNVESLLLQKESTEQQVELNLLNAFDAYTTSLFILNSQKDNVETATRNFERSQEAFRNGQISSVEFRQAQLNLLTAEIQLSQSEINSKNAELQVLALAGRIGG
ncbi:MAG: TolC family protein [Flavobacteriales bacterium]